MRKLLIILISTAITALNINSYGELDTRKLEQAKLMANSPKEITLSESLNLGIGSALFKIIHVAEIMFLSEFGRRRIKIM
ncbi:hypothetical protein [Polaribacter porphyrae]|uniref:Uncharacterized protein n=1 Tax=Polaribacter porphyrae TaxID=1137780 RepID=A0A2S7WJR4_9FLAO|nr:hypothetical protein [Polaribacter porphyrae]PQJ77849.1 hypothetical protein BTO18_01005 [Polaribacter porphyrae]